jgi:hypothetical protein
LADIDKRVADSKAKAEWQTKLIAQYDKSDKELRTKEDAAKKAGKTMAKADVQARAKLDAQLADAKKKAAEAEDFIKGISTHREQVSGDYEAQKKKRNEAASFLAEAEEKRAKQQMAK